MGLHIGETKYPAAIRFHRGTISAKGYRDSEVYHQHPIRRWYGVSFAGKWFLGLILTAPTEDVREPGAFSR